MVSKRAAEFLAAELRDAITQLQSIDNAIGEMQAKREAQAVKVDLLKKVVGQDSQPELPLRAEPKSEQPSLTRSPALDTPLPSLELPNPVEQHAAGGFRAEIRNVLSAATKGMRSRDVHEELVKRGVPFNGKVEPAIRTYQELYRMAKNGQVRRRAGLYYPPQPSSMQ